MKTPPFPSIASPRRTALAVAVCLLSAAPLWAADYTSLAGVKAEGFRKWLDDAKDQGYVPIYVNGYDVGDHSEYAGVAAKTKTPFEARFDMTSDEYNDFYKEMKDKGFHPNCISGYHTRGGPRFAAVWLKDKNTLKWKTRHNQPQKDYEDTVASMRDEGLVPVCVTAYQAADGNVRYTSLFYEPYEGEKVETRHNLTSEQLTDQVNKWRSNGFLLWRVHAYDTPDGLRFLATARNKGEPSGTSWKERHGMTGDQYQKEFDKMGQEGYYPRCICGYLDGGEVRFAAIWIKTP